MSETSTLIGYKGRTIPREELALVPTPPATDTHRPVPHNEIVQALVETLGFRHIGVVHDEYAVSPDGMKMFGVLDLETEMHGARFAIGLRNSHDKTMRLALTCGYRVFVCSNMAFSGDFTTETMSPQSLPRLAHSRWSVGAGQPRMLTGTPTFWKTATIHRMEGQSGGQTAVAFLLDLSGWRLQRSVVVDLMRKSPSAESRGLCRLSCLLASGFRALGHFAKSRCSV